MVPLYKPYMPVELPELNYILHSGALSYGKWGKEFEVKLRSYIGVENLMTTNTYAMAIQIALTVLGLKSGDEVISSPMSCLASNQPLVTYGLKVRWADIDPKTGTLSPESVRKAINSKTKLIFHNHYCGYLGHVDEINNIGKEFGIPIIDDCIEAFASKYKGKYAGNLGSDVTVFSFQTVRLPNTIDGGAIVFKNKELYQAGLLCRDFGIRRDIFRDNNGEISSSCDISVPGYGATMSEINSYIGCAQMNDLSLLLDKQRANAVFWNDLINGYKLNSRMSIEPNYWVYGFLSDNKESDMISIRKAGYYTSGVHLPNNYYSVFGNKTRLNGVEEFYKKFLAIPCGWWFKNGNRNY